MPEDVQPGNSLPVIGHPGYYYNPKMVASNQKALLPVEGKSSVPIKVITVEEEYVANSHDGSTISINVGLDT